MMEWLENGAALLIINVLHNDLRKIFLESKCNLLIVNGSF